MSSKKLANKNGFTIIEVSIVFLLILAVTFLVVPRSLDSTRQAKLISKWTQTYSEIEYMFSAIKAQHEGLIVNSKNATKEQQKSALLEVIKPYLRVTSAIKDDYEQYYMNKMDIAPASQFYFSSFYNTRLGMILGLKWINKNCENGEVCAIMSLDINGITPPNAWGYDVYGINVYKDKIEPMGKEVSEDVLKMDCHKHGSGVFCSYYYLIGGRFD